MKLNEIMQVFRGARKHPTGVSHITVTQTQGGLFYQLQHLDDLNNDREAIFFHIPLVGRSENDALMSLASLLESNDLYPHLIFHEERVYLRKNKIPHLQIREFLSSIGWLGSEHRSTFCLLYNQTRFPFHHQQTNVHGQTEFNYTIFFHRDFRTIQQKIADATFMVFTESSKPVGSAFILKIGDTVRILSAAHVGGEGEHLNVKIGDARMLSVTVARGKADVALLNPKEDFDFQDALDMGSSARCEVGDTIYVCGYPAKMGVLPTLSKGHVSKVNAEYNGESDLLQVSSMAINPNNSGGPVVDFQGKVVGILTTRAIKSDVQNIAFAEPIEKAVEELIKG